MNNTDEQQQRTWSILIPWWHRASKVAALILLLNGLAMIWYALLYKESLWLFMGFAIWILIWAAICGSVVRE